MGVCSICFHIFSNSWCGGVGVKDSRSFKILISSLLSGALDKY